MQNRNSTTRHWIWGLVGLAGLILLAVGLSTAGMWKIGRAPYGLDLPRVVAKVGEESISRDLVYQRMRQHEGMRPGGFKNKEVEAMKRLAARVVDQLIQQRLILHEASRLGVSVTDDEVERQYARTQENFGSQEDFEKKLKEGNTDPQTLKRDIRDFIFIQKVDFSLQQQIEIMDQEVRDFFDANKEQIFQGQTLEDHREHVVNILRSQKWQAQKQDWMNRLYQQTEIWKAPEVSF